MFTDYTDEEVKELLRIGEKPSKNDEGVKQTMNKHIGTFDSETLTYMRRFGGLHKYQAGEFVFREGDKAHFVYILLSGRVAIIKTKDEGMLVCEELKSGAVIAESALYESDVYEMGLYVLEDTMLFQCSTETFLHMLRAKRDIAYKTLRAYAARIMNNIQTSD